MTMDIRPIFENLATTNQIAILLSIQSDNNSTSKPIGITHECQQPNIIVIVLDRKQNDYSIKITIGKLE